MSDPEKLADRARLDELAAVTKAYAVFSGAGAGLAASVIGAWLLAAAWALRTAPRLGELLLVFAPLAAIVLLSGARAYYQRHGEVVATPDEGSWLVRMWLGLVFLMTLEGIEKQFEGTRQGYELLAVAAFLATAMLAVRLARSRPGHMVLVGTLTIVASADSHRPTADAPTGHDWAVIIGGVALVAAGIVSHVQYHRLERRLAALKGSAP